MLSDFGIDKNNLVLIAKRKNESLLKKIEKIRLSSELKNGNGRVSGKVLPKFALLSNL